MPLIAVRFALYADLMLAFGLPLFAVYTRRGGNGAAIPAWTVPMLALGGAALAVVALVLLTATMNDVPVGQVDCDMLGAVVGGTAIGTAVVVRVAALLAAALAGLALAGRRRWLAQSALGGAALASLAWTGHGAAGEGASGMVHLAADIGHLLAAGIWLGALAGLLLMLGDPGGDNRAARIARAHRALAGFAPIGSLAVAALIATGVVNSWFVVGPGNVGSLAATLYGRVLIVKLALFVAMLGLAAANRFVLTPALAGAGGEVAALRPVRRSITVEASLALGVLGLVAWLGTLPPPG